MPKRKKSVANILQEQGSVIMPGVYDALSAKIAARVGFELCFISGYGTSASHLGMPDMGFLNQSDLCNVAQRICAATDITVIADADTGYGNELNVRQTIQRLIAAGVDGCFLEDQQWPKRCGHMRGKQVVARDEFINKIRAAVDARGDADFFIVARTDALATDGLDEALARVNKAQQAGVDGFFIEAPENREQMERICQLSPAPRIANMIEGGKTPLLSRNDLADMGYSLILYPLTSLYAAARSVSEQLTALRKNEIGNQEGLIPFAEFNDLIGAEELIRINEKARKQ